jgi:hypothetical protein
MEEEREDLGKYITELLDLMSESQQGEQSDKFWKMAIREIGVPGKRSNHLSKSGRRYLKNLVQ